MIGSDPSPHINFPKFPQTCLAFWIFLRTAGQFSSDQCNSRPRYFNESNPSTLSAPYSPVRLKVSSVHLFSIATASIFHLIFVFLSHLSVRQCFISCPAGMCIPHKSQRCGSSTPHLVFLLVSLESRVNYSISLCEFSPHHQSRTRYLLQSLF